MRNKGGFSLVELSIVLVILGLLTGGILAGQSLIRAAELKSVSTEYQRFLAATHTFRDKYMAWPGDMPNATSFWGRADTGTNTGQCAAPKTTAGTGTQTCNGNGDGMLAASDNIGGTGWDEPYRYWEHLANAGLVEGDYTGIIDSSSASGWTASVNAPSSKVAADSRWTIAWYGPRFGHAQDFDGNYRNLLNITSASPPFLPEEAWNIDTKLDDGKPGMGSARARKPAAQPDCTTSADGSTSDYMLTITSKTCRLQFSSF